MPAVRKSYRRSRASHRRAGKSLKGLAKGAVHIGSRAVSGTVNTAKNTVTKTASNAAKTATETVDFARHFSKDVVDALETVVNGLINGAGSVVDTAGSVTESVLTDLFDVKATHVFKGAGTLAKQLADNIGGAVRQIPYVGNATGYVVESAGGGVFHVILSVGKLIGSTSRRLGRVAKKTTDLVVFTLHAGRDQIKDTAVSVDDIVDRVGNSLVGRSGKSAKTLKSAGGRRVRRRRRGGMEKGYTQSASQPQSAGASATADRTPAKPTAPHSITSITSSKPFEILSRHFKQYNQVHGHFFTDIIKELTDLTQPEVSRLSTTFTADVTERDNIMSRITGTSGLTLSPEQFMNKCLSVKTLTHDRFNKATQTVEESFLVFLKTIISAAIATVSKTHPLLKKQLNKAQVAFFETLEVQNGEESPNKLNRIIRINDAYHVFYEETVPFILSGIKDRNEAFALVDKVKQLNGEFISLVTNFNFSSPCNFSTIIHEAMDNEDGTTVQFQKFQNYKQLLDLQNQRKERVAVLEEQEIQNEAEQKALSRYKPFTDSAMSEILQKGDELEQCGQKLANITQMQDVFNSTLLEAQKQFVATLQAQCQAHNSTPVRTTQDISRTGSRPVVETGE